MRYWLIHWLLSGVALLIVAQILPGIQVEGFGAALIAALVIGLVSATLGLLLKIVLLPFIILSLGVVYFLINGLMLKLASEFVPGFRVNGCLPAVLGAILLTIVDYILTRLAGMCGGAGRNQPDGQYADQAALDAYVTVTRGRYSSLSHTKLIYRNGK